MSTTELGGVLGTPRGTGWELWTAAPFEWQMQETRLRPGGGWCHGCWFGLRSSMTLEEQTLLEEHGQTHRPGMSLLS